MPRKQPTENIDYIGQLDAEPINAVGEYLTSKRNDRNFMKPPNFGAIGDDIEGSYILAKLENELAMKHLNILEENKKLQRKIFQHRVSRTYKDHAVLRLQFIDVNTFLRDIAEKKKEAFRKINNEIDIQQQLTAEIDFKTKKINDLKVFRKVLKSTTDEYMAYESVLNAAANKLNLLSMRPLINRCDAIMVAQDDITQLNNEKLESIEAMRKRIVEIIKQAELIYGGLKNELAQMSRSYNKAQSEGLRWEKILLNTNTAIISKNMEKALVRDGINQIYRTLCRWKRIDPKFVRKDVARSLDFIKTEVEVMTEVIAEYHHPTL